MCVQIKVRLHWLVRRYLRTLSDCQVKEIVNINHLCNFSQIKNDMSAVVLKCEV